MALTTLASIAQIGDFVVGASNLTLDNRPKFTLLLSRHEMVDLAAQEIECILIILDKMEPKVEQYGLLFHKKAYRALVSQAKWQSEELDRFVETLHDVRSCTKWFKLWCQARSLYKSAQHDRKSILSSSRRLFINLRDLRAKDMQGSAISVDFEEALKAWDQPLKNLRGSVLPVSVVTQRSGSSNYDSDTSSEVSNPEEDKDLFTMKNVDIDTSQVELAILNYNPTPRASTSKGRCT